MQSSGYPHAHGCRRRRGRCGGVTGWPLRRPNGAPGRGLRGQHDAAGHGGLGRPRGPSRAPETQAGARAAQVRHVTGAGRRRGRCGTRVTRTLERWPLRRPGGGAVRHLVDQSADDLILQIEYRVDGAVRRQRTGDLAGAGIDQPRRDSQSLPHPLVAAAHHPPDSQLAPQPRRSCRVDRHAVGAWQHRDDLLPADDLPTGGDGQDCRYGFRDTVPYPVVRSVARDVRERDDGKRPIGQRAGAVGRAFGGLPGWRRLHARGGSSRHGGQQHHEERNRDTAEHGHVEMTAPPGSQTPVRDLPNGVCCRTLRPQVQR